MNDDDPVVCVCREVTEDAIVALIRAGHRSVAEIRAASGASGGCGGCADDIAELVEDEAGVSPSRLS
ncbi:(2Fe-2S)-binding protein [Actinomadura atramentaria]|uniref:(2Fe-2S)-binding protein n=1 Tax=Actinomadura atramentaria TaxID=1990 RepID=UPI0003716961|nr:(2Fe-2S)-binding protein [Actinomadura atramentaria]